MWPLLLPLSSSSVSICVCLSPTCPSFTEAICSILSSMWIPESSQGKGWGECGLGKRAEPGLGPVGTPEPQVAGTWVPPQLCFALTTCLASFPSAQHWGGRFLGGNREGPYWLVPS